MVALKIVDLKDFTAKVFMGDLFDRWLLREAEIVTFNAFAIDGRIRRDFYTREEREEKGIGEYSEWRMIRPVCFSLIKGKKLPGSFHITLQLFPAAVEQFLATWQLNIQAEQIGGLYLNIRYEDKMVRCVTGTALQIFTLDKKVEFAWDEAVRQMLKEQGIACVTE